MFGVCLATLLPHIDTAQEFVPWKIDMPCSIIYRQRWQLQLSVFLLEAFSKSGSAPAESTTSLHHACTVKNVMHTDYQPLLVIYICMCRICVKCIFYGQLTMPRLYFSGGKLACTIRLVSTTGLAQCGYVFRALHCCMLAWKARQLVVELI